LTATHSTWLVYRRKSATPAPTPITSTRTSGNSPRMANWCATSSTSPATSTAPMLWRTTGANAFLPRIALPARDDVIAYRRQLRRHRNDAPISRRPSLVAFLFLATAARTELPLGRYGCQKDIHWDFPPSDALPAPPTLSQIAVSFETTLLRWKRKFRGKNFGHLVAGPFSSCFPPITPLIYAICFTWISYLFSSSLLLQHPSVL